MQQLNHHILINTLKQAFVLLFFLCSYAIVVAQNYKEDIIKMNEKYQQATSFKMNIEMKISYKTDADAPVIEKGVIKKQGDNYYSDFADKITLKNKNYSVLVLKSEQLLTYMEIGNNTYPAEQSNQPDYLALFKADTNNLDKHIKLIAATKESKTYEMVLKQNGIEKMHLKMSNEHVMQQITYFYETSDENPIKEVVINYNNVTLNPKFSAYEFSEKQFFVIKNNKAIPSEKFKTYTINKQH